MFEFRDFEHLTNLSTCAYWQDIGVAYCRFYFLLVERFGIYQILLIAKAIEVRDTVDLNSISSFTFLAFKSIPNLLPNINEIYRYEKVN